MSEPEDILARYWGYTSFRPMQKEVIQALVKGQDVLSLMPTGGGKSMCFQIPTMLKPGICIVISPLVALMEDQVNSLQSRGIKAMALTGSLSFKEMDTLLDNCIYGNYKFLYLSPERMGQELVRERIRQMPVNLIAVDEAHCISQWGHDFRPAYLKIAELRNLHPNVPVIALTATATKEVEQDIAVQLQSPDIQVLKRSFTRPNLAYRVEKTLDKEGTLIKILEKSTHSAIVFVRTRKATWVLAEKLTAAGISAAAFHGGLDKAEKSLRLQKWLSQEDRVMVATNAFGMGVDKSNVHTVVHLNLPDSLENYFQEAGRAGRDGVISKAVVLAGRNDILVLEKQFLQALPTVDLVKRVYRKLLTQFGIAYGEGENTEHHFNFQGFCTRYQLDARPAYNALMLLDRMGILKFTEQFHETTRIRFLVTSRQLNHFLERNSKYSSLVNAILRTFGGIFDNSVEVDLNPLCRKLGISRGSAIFLLQHLHAQQILDLEHHEHDSRVILLLPREDDITINPLTPQIKAHLENRRKKISQVAAYISNENTCRSQQLLHYFGEKETDPCGICSVCAPSGDLPDREEMKRIYLKMKKLMQAGACTASTLATKIHVPENHIWYMIQILREKNIIKRTASLTYKLNQL